ncbi:hypothetical protein IWQ60_010403 [Tieghemiomyces parasiticus]|uniref:Peptidase S1 domain-containing protein n=1 Tax=Tieghemiomyces parasiticus TaxID=78921 RepID=A0A9W7ZQH7_9FUNG|nr:hypothetical protein IWQ60_010403 [Tieghemiomyces parasiticus]
MATCLAATTVVAVPTAKEAAQFGRIIGGTKVSSDTQFPFISHLEITSGNELIDCGCSLLSDEWFLTAGHCVTDVNTGIVHPAASLGFTVGTLSADISSQYKGSKIVVHPNFNVETLENDIALVKVTKQVSFSSTVQPVKILTSSIKSGDQATAIGWGSTNGVDTTQQASTLEAVNVTVSSDPRQCITLGGTFSNSNGPQVCTADNPSKDTCQGDSGGPLVVSTSDGSYAQIGVTSYGYSPSNTASCGAADGIAFYTHVSYYLPFITNTTGLDAGNITVGDNSTGSSSGSPTNTYTSGGSVTASALGLTAGLVLLTLACL